MNKIYLFLFLLTTVNSLSGNNVICLLNPNNAFISSVSPSQNAINIATDEVILIQFAQNMTPSLLNSNIKVYGALSGAMQIQVSYSQSTFLATVTTANNFKAGELITVCIGSGNTTSVGQAITPFIFNFWVKSSGGSGWFAVGDTLVTGTNPEFITSGDIDADGKIDLAVVNYEEGSVTVCKNDGSAHFSITQEFNGFSHPWHCAFADIDGDKALDLIIPDFEGFKVFIYQNNGTGLFLPPAELDLGIGIYPFSVAMFDIDGDTDLDMSIAIQGNNWKVFHYQNNGTGSFTYLGSNDCVIHPKFILPMDMENDGDLDLVINHFSDNIPMMILTNSGQGIFTQSYTGQIGQRSDGISMGDLNSDNYIDIVTPNDYVDGLHYLLNDNAGNFNFYNLGVFGSRPWFSAINDFDGDGDHDFVIVNRDYYNFAPFVSLGTNNGSNNFSLSPASYYPGSVPSCVTAADFDNDGDVDLAASLYNGNSFVVLVNSSDSLVAYYPFNDNANDASGNLNHGVVNGAVLTTDRYGIADRAYYFDGGNSNIEGINPGNNLPSSSQQRTISCWVQSTEAIGDKNIFHYGTTQVAPTNYHLFLNLGNQAGVGNGYGYGTLISGTDIGDNAWHFVTGVYEGETTNLQHIFIDGKLDASAAISTTPNTVLSSNWKMGQFMGGSQSLLGKIDELRVFSIALNNQDVMNLYLAETTAPVLLEPANQTTVTTPTPIMQWNSTFTNAEYKLQVASDSVFTELLYETTTTNSAVQLPEGLLAVGITFYWRIRTTLNGETGPWSEVWTFTYMNTGIQEPITGLPSLTVTPNPADLYVKFIYSLPGAVAGQKPVTIEIINAIGKPLANLLNLQLPPGVYETRFDTHRLESGIYFCRLKAGNHVLIRKLVVMH